MSVRIKNFKYFVATTCIVATIGTIGVVTLNTKDTVFGKNEAKFNYTIDYNKTVSDVDTLLIGEHLFNSSDDYAQKENMYRLAIAKKIIRLNNRENEITNELGVIDSKFRNEGMVSNEYSNYKKTKDELISKNINRNKQFFIASDVYMLDEKDGYAYTKEFILHMDTETGLVSNMVVVDAEFNHVKDDIKYMNICEADESYINSLNDKITEIMDIYKSLSESYWDLLNKEGLNVAKAYIRDSKTIRLEDSNGKVVDKVIGN